MNGGFGLVLDGSEDAAKKARSMLNWDVSNGVARRYVKRGVRMLRVKFLSALVYLFKAYNRYVK